MYKITIQKDDEEPVVYTYTNARIKEETCMRNIVSTTGESIAKVPNPMRGRLLTVTAWGGCATPEDFVPEHTVTLVERT
jgi:hypothetical protein